MQRFFIIHHFFPDLSIPSCLELPKKNLLVFNTDFSFSYDFADCPCAGKRPDNLDDDDGYSAPLIPIATNNELFPWNNVRLPDSLIPMRYRIHIHPNLTTLGVKGQVTIEFNCKKETNFIVLHSKNLTIVEKVVLNNKGEELEIDRFLEYTYAQQIYIETKEYFTVGMNYSLNIRYQSKLGRELEGFYLSSYVNKDGVTR